MTRERPTRCAPGLAAAATLTALIATMPAVAQAQSAVASRPATTTGAAMLATIEALTGPGMDGRAAGTAGNLKARAWIEARLKAIGVTPLSAGGYGHPFTFTSRNGETVRGVNLVAMCPGPAAASPAQAMVVSAHYDHLGIRNGQTYPGADDNASGVAMLLVVAERCVKTPFTRPVMLVAFDGEEAGLQGAKAFVAQPPLPRERLALNVNFDMISRSDRREIYVAGPGHWPRLRPVLAPVVQVPDITVRFGHDTGGGHDDWTTQSDHGAFHAAGIPWVYFGVEDHADYHRPTDTADKIAPSFLDRVADVVLTSLTALDRAAAFK